MGISVAIVDDHAVLRDGLVAILSAQQDMRVVGTAANGRDGLKLVSELCPPIPANEDERLRSLQACGILDTPRELLFDGLTELAAAICAAPIALLSLIDRDRQWFKSSHGLIGLAQTPRDVAFCAHAILSDALFEVPDAVLMSAFMPIRWSWAV